MVKRVELSEGKFYKCGMILRDSEYGMQYTDTLKISSKTRGENLPVYAIFQHGRLREVATGNTLVLTPIANYQHYEYSNRLIEELERFHKTYFNVETAFEVSKKEVALFLKDIERDNLVSKYRDELNKENQEQHREIARWLNIKKKRNIDLIETNKILRKYIHN